jgi:hypothetical protein
VDTASGPQKSSALEVCETSSIGRALAKQATQGTSVPRVQEMEKVQRFEEREKARDWVAEAKLLTDKDRLRLLWGEASKAGAPQDVLDQVKAHAEAQAGDK